MGRRLREIEGAAKRLAKLRRVSNRTPASPEEIRAASNRRAETPTRLAGTISVLCASGSRDFIAYITLARAAVAGAP